MTTTEASHRERFALSADACQAGMAPLGNPPVGQRTVCCAGGHALLRQTVQGARLQGWAPARM